MTITAVIDEQAVERPAPGGRWGRFSAQVIRRYWATATTSGPVEVTDDGFAARAQRTHEGGPVAWPVAPTPDTEVVTAVDADAFVADFVSVIAAGDGNGA